MTERSVGDVLERGQAEDRRRALRALLRHPLLTPSGPDPAAFNLVRRHAAWLREWLGSEAGWALQVDASLARLHKLPSDPWDATRPAQPDPGRTPFGRRRYVLFCLALAALERADAQITLGKLADHIVLLAGDADLVAAGFEFSLTSRERRGDLVAVTRLLLGLHALTRVAGDEQGFLNQSGDVLYDVNRRVLAALLVARRGPSVVSASSLEDRIAALVGELVPEGEDARNRAIRHRLTRRLLEDPVVYYAELTEEELTYLSTQRPFLLRRVADATGLLAEVRAEGIALLDPSGEATDLAMPEEGTDGHATLLVAEFLAGTLRAGSSEPVPLASLESMLQAAGRDHRAFWRRAATEPGAEISLCAQAVARLEALGLAARTADGVEPRPAIARYAYQAPTLSPNEEALS